MVFKSSSAGLLLLVISVAPLASATIVVQEDCTLAQAIVAANSDAATADCPAGAGADDIELTAEVLLTAVDNSTDGPNGLPSVTSEITILGNGFEIRRESLDAFRLLHVAASGDLTMEEAIASNGLLEDDSSARGGGVFNLGRLALVSSTVAGNETRALLPDGESWGGGIYSGADAELDLDYARVVENQASGWQVLGAGLHNLGNANVTASRVQGNTGTSDDVGRGGGISSDGVLQVNSSTIAGNAILVENGGSGGGLGAVGSLVLTQSTVSGNLVIGYGPNPSVGGGGVSIGNGGTISNTTISSNDASGYFIYGDDLLANGPVTADHVTIFGSFSACCGADTGLTFSNSLVWGGCGRFTGTQVVDGGNNLATTDGCGIPGGLTGVLPDLADNGGPTLTHHLASDSSALDLVADCEETSDQRFGARGEVCDAGAVEFGTDCLNGLPFNVWLQSAVTADETHESCYRLRAAVGFDVDPGVTAVLRAARRVEFSNGAQVTAGANLKIEIDPTLGSGPSLP